MLGSLSFPLDGRKKNGCKNNHFLFWVVIIPLLIFTTWGCDKKVSDPQTSPPRSPVAKFSVSTQKGNAPLKVRFENHSSGDISTYRWNFGDGHTSSDWSTDHTYNSPGTYKPSLTVWGPGGTDTKKFDGHILVGLSQSAQFTMEWFDLRGRPGYVGLLANLRISGYRGRTFAMGGYWLQKKGSSYHYVTTKCPTNVPGKYLGHQWDITVTYDQEDIRPSFYISYNCFPSQTGIYYGVIQLYHATGYPVDPNSPTKTRTKFVELRLSGKSPDGFNDQTRLNARVLSDREAEQLERTIAASGGIRYDPAEMNETSDLPDTSWAEKLQNNRF